MERARHEIRELIKGPLFRAHDPLTLPFLANGTTAVSTAASIRHDNSLLFESKTPGSPPLHADWQCRPLLAYHMFRGYNHMMEICSYRRGLQLVSLSGLLPDATLQSFCMPIHPSEDIPQEEQVAWQAFREALSTTSFERMADALQSRWVSVDGKEHVFVYFSVAEKGIVAVHDIEERVMQVAPETTRILIVFEGIPTHEMTKYEVQNNAHVYRRACGQSEPEETGTVCLKFKKAASKKPKGDKSRDEKDAADPEEVASTKKARKAVAKKPKGDTSMDEKDVPEDTADDEQDTEEKPPGRKSTKKATATTTKKKKTSKKPKTESNPGFTIKTPKVPRLPAGVQRPWIELFAFSGPLSSLFTHQKHFPHARIMKDPQEVLSLTRSLQLRHRLQLPKTLASDPAARVYGAGTDDVLVYYETIGDRGFVERPTIVVDDNRRVINPHSKGKNVT
jgi:hypothetical protein